MRVLLLPASLFLLASLAACGGSGGGQGPAPALDLSIYVDAVNGSDTTGTGASDAPFKTIRKGLITAGIGDVVRVRAGLYDAANGESFPIRPGFGTTIIGTERVTVLGKQRLSRVVGGALWSGDPLGRLHATMVPSLDNRIVGLAIMNPQPFVIGGPKPAPIVLAMQRVTIESCLLHDSDKGVRMVEGVRFATLKDCDITRNGIGIFVDGAGTDNLVERNRVTVNSAGVMIFAAGGGGVDFGGGALGGLGGNAFAGNGVDFVHFSGSPETIYAIGNAWDHSPPTRAPADPNGDISENNSGPVLTEPSSVYVPPVPFSGTPPPATFE